LSSHRRSVIPRDHPDVANSGVPPPGPVRLCAETGPMASLPSVLFLTAATSRSYPACRRFDHKIPRQCGTVQACLARKPMVALPGYGGPCRGSIWTETRTRVCRAGNEGQWLPQGRGSGELEEAIPFRCSATTNNRNRAASRLKVTQPLMIFTLKRNRGGLSHAALLRPSRWFPNRHATGFHHDDRMTSQRSCR
jgi:hypothetical protein